MVLRADLFRCAGVSSRSIRKYIKLERDKKKCLLLILCLDIGLWRVIESPRSHGFRTSRHQMVILLQRLSLIRIHECLHIVFDLLAGQCSYGS